MKKLNSPPNERVLGIIKGLRGIYPDVKVELNFGNVWELMVAVILSAQCTDVRVNKVTPELFKKYPTVKSFASCDLRGLEQKIYSIGFFKNKAKNIKATATKIMADFGGKVPSTMAELITLPGVARKTANVILTAGFGKNDGIVVDTHVIRLSGLLGLASTKAVKAKNAVQIEKELMEIVPRSAWGDFSNLLVWHGRRICIARRPQCGKCVISRLCPSSRT
ncbi:MAG: endonuclease III [Candidatus Gracilibacteria bacterium]|jgi:endonuclease-3